MDDRRFDDLTRALTTLAPRRAAFRFLTGGTLAGVLAALGVAAQPARRARASHECAPLDYCCRYCEKVDPPFEPGQCVFVEDRYIGCCSSENTVCGTHCCPPGQTCIPPDSTSPWLPGGGCCPGDQPILCGRNCCRGSDACCEDGACCGPPYQCEGGKCKPPCPDGKFRCGEWGCCDNGKICDNGECKACPGGGASCGTQCCAENQTCSDNQCVDICATLRSGRTARAAQVCCAPDEQECGTSCCRPGQRCCSGQGGPSCCNDGDGFCCGGVCCAVDRVCVADGFCDERCPQGLATCGRRCCAENQECIDNQCVPRCSKLVVRCGRTCCGENQICKGGVCSDCPRGQLADPRCNQCRDAIVSCPVDPRTCECCPRGTKVCGGRCVNTNSSEDHCGQCGNHCRKGRKCRNGRCR